MLQTRSAFKVGCRRIRLFTILEGVAALVACWVFAVPAQLNYDSPPARNQNCHHSMRETQASGFPITLRITISGASKASSYCPLGNCTYSFQNSLLCNNNGLTKIFWDSKWLLMAMNLLSLSLEVTVGTVGKPLISGRNVNTFWKLLLST